MGFNNRKTERVHFEFGYTAAIMAIDGTWQRRCMIEDISKTGARLTIEGSLENLKLDEFFLVLSRSGQAHRRCQLVWLKGDSIGLRFLQSKLIAEAGSRPKRRIRFADEATG